jgi:streptogramin lyase
MPKQTPWLLLLVVFTLHACREADDLLPNSPPIANAGSDQNINSGTKVILDGSQSSDADGDSLMFNWILTSKPANSKAFLSSMDSIKTSFIADAAGTYKFKLIVSDGISNAQDSVTVQALYMAKLMVSTLATVNSGFYAALGPDGNIYVSGYSTHVIYKITTAGVVTTFAGTGVAGYLNEKTSNAQFRNPSGLAFDGSGNLYIADYGNHCVRKINTSNVVSTFAGFPQAGYVDAVGGQAQFNGITGLIIDSKNNIYVSETVNLRIRKITQQAAVSTFAGNGKPGLLDTVGILSQFRAPVSLAIDATDNIYVADATNHCIRKITPSAQVTTIAGTGIAGYLNGAALSAQFSNPYGIAIGSNNTIFIADYTNNRIRQIYANEVTNYAGSGIKSFTNGEAPVATFNGPTGLLYTTNGTLYVMDYTNNSIRKIALE